MRKLVRTVWLRSPPGSRASGKCRGRCVPRRNGVIARDGMIVVKLYARDPFVFQDKVSDFV